MSKADLSVDRLRELLQYSPHSGLFVRRRSISGRNARKGAVAGCDNGQGYIVISVDRCVYRAHRLAFLYMTGHWPTDEVDHINGIRSDNRWSNLRNASTQENTHNQRTPQRNGSTGFLGVRFYGGKFRAAIGLDGVRRHLGTFPSAELAHAAYLAAKRKLHSNCTI